MAPQKAAGSPANSLILSGALGVLYSAIYLGWTAMPLIWGFLVVGINLSEKGLTFEAIQASLMFVGMPALQFCGYLVCLASAVTTLLGGIRFNQYRSKGLVTLGLVGSTLTPVLGLMVTTGSAISCGTMGMGLFGCLIGNVGTAPLLVVGVVASVWGMVVLSDPERAARFDAV